MRCISIIANINRSSLSFIASHLEIVSKSPDRNDLECLTNTQSMTDVFLRTQVYNRLKHQRKLEKKKLREKRKREQDSLGENAPPKQIPRTLDNTREADETMVAPDDEETLTDEKLDEFSDYYADGRTPKLLITSSVFAHMETLEFIDQLIDIFPNSHFYKRGTFSLKKIVQYAINQDFTDLLVVNEDRKVPNGIIFMHLPYGPTALFKLSSIKLRKDIPDHGNPTGHKPEIILNNFNTRLGHTIGRMFGSLFPQQPEFKGRSVATFHNQRDFIFVRHHRYIFENKEKVRLQELGPRFCLKLRSLQKGTFDSKTGEYEWYFRSKMATSRKKFFL